MAHENDACVLINKFLDSGERSANTRIVGNNAIFNGNVEVHAYEHLLALSIELIDCLDVCHLILHSFDAFP